MIIDDEKLSGFLDAELAEAEMQLVREAVAGSEAIADRLAELAQVDFDINQTYSEIDQRPVPQAILELLSDEKDQTIPASAEIIEFPLWKRVHHGMQKYTAVAACAMLVLGYGLASFNASEQSASSGQINSEVAQVLFERSSGEPVKLANGSAVLPRASFNNKQNRICRQYQMNSASGVSENIACLQQSQWQLAAMVSVAASDNAENYQTASGGRALDSVLDQMMVDGFYNQEQENQAIKRGWKN